MKLVTTICCVYVTCFVQLVDVPSMESMETLLSSVQFNETQNAIAPVEAADAQVPDLSQEDLLQVTQY